MPRHATIGRLWIAFALGLGLAIACGPKGDRELGEACDVDGDCDEGMYCAEDGPLAGQCTRDCEPTPDPCADRFGEGAFCNGNQNCARACTEDVDCPSGARCVNEACDR